MFWAELIKYHEEFRTALFLSGFTLGTFLFSMKSTILATMKKEYYDQDAYKKDIDQRIKLGQNIGYYQQLKNLSRFIFLAILLSFISAISQITIGYLSTCWSSSICLTLAFASWIVVGVCVWVVSSNFQKAFDMDEKKSHLERQHKENKD